MCSCTCLSNTPTFFRLVSSPSWLFWKFFLKSTMEANFCCSSLRKVSNPWFSSTLTSNSKTSSSLLLNFFVHWANLILSYLSPSKSKQAQNQTTLNQSNCKQIKSIKLPSNQISPNKIKPNQISSNQIKSNYGKQFNSMNQGN